MIYSDEFDNCFSTFFSHIKYFNMCNTEDFVYLYNLDISDYDKKENLDRVGKILNELHSLALVYETVNLETSGECYDIEDERLAEIDELAEESFTFLKMIKENKCKHPLLDVINNLTKSSVCYDMFFIAFESMAMCSKTKKYKKMCDDYSDTLIGPIENERNDRVDNLFINIDAYDCKLLAFEIEDIVRTELYKKAFQIEKPYYTGKELNFDALEYIDGKIVRFARNKSKMAASCEKLINELIEIKNEHGDEPIDMYQDIFEEEDKPVYSTDNDFGNRLIAINTVSDYGLYNNKKFTVKNYVDAIFNMYYLHKCYEEHYVEASTVYAKKMGNCQDM